MDDENKKDDHPAARGASLSAPDGSDMERRLRRSEDARRSLSNAVDFLQKRERNLRSALDRIANCEQDCSERDAVFFMREIARLSLDSEKEYQNVEDSQEGWPRTSGNDED